MVGCPNLEDEQQKDGDNVGGEDNRFNFHWFHVFTLLRV